MRLASGHQPPPRRLGLRAAGAALLLIGIGCGEPPHEGPSQLREVASPSGMQAATVYRDSLGACGTCRIRITAAGALGEIGDSILLMAMPIIERDRRGRLYATAPNFRGQEIILFDSAGTIVRPVGRGGDGPGEYRSVWDMQVGPGDSLFVGHGLTVTVFDSAGQYARSVRRDGIASPLGTRFVDIRRDTLVLSELKISDSPIEPLQYYDRDGRHLRSSGPPDLRAVHFASMSPGARPALANGMRKTAVEPDGSIWVVAATGGYRLDRVTREGRVDRTIGVVPPASWNVEPLLMSLADAQVLLPPPRRAGVPARPHATPRSTSVRRPTSRPSGVVRDVSVVERGLIAVLVHVPADDWQDASVALDTTVVPATAAPGYQQQLYDTVVDFIEVASGRVVARRRVDGTFYFTSSGYAYRPSVSATGVIGAEVFKVDLIR